MLLIVIRKMLKNRWMTLCILIGCVLAVTVISSIPMYSFAMLQRMLQKDFESIQTGRGIYPGYYSHVASVNLVPDSTITSYDRFAFYDKLVDRHLENDIEFPLLARYRHFDMGAFYYKDDDIPPEGFGVPNINLLSTEQLNDHIVVTSGRMFSSELTEDGVYEALATQQALDKSGMLIGRDYWMYKSLKRPEEKIRIRIVGTFTVSDEADVYWLNKLTPYNNGIVINYDLFAGTILSSESALFGGTVTWNEAIDYTKVDVDAVEGLYDVMNRFTNDNVNGISTKTSILTMLKEYSERYDRLNMTLWILQIPVILMLAFYIFMVAKLSIDYESNEIAVMKSRGASGTQILRSYFYEALLLGGLALIIGIPLGILACRLVGSTSGFLEFVQRTAVTIKFTPKTMLFSLAAVGVFVLTMLIPAAAASRTTIVAHKRTKTGRIKLSLWEKIGMDVIMIAVSLYGFKLYSDRQTILFATGANSSEIPVDPLLFVMSTVFILGMGLLFIRLFPYLVRLIYRIGRRFWSPVLYSSLINVSRSGGRDRFIMLFIILTLSIGIFNATAARTINKSEEDKIRYSVGADIVFKTNWPTAAPAISAGPGESLGASLPQSSSSNSYTHEPQFDIYRKMEGVESATRVFRNDKSTISKVGNVSSKTTATYMSVTADEFGKTAWFRSDLLPHHIYEYLNLISLEPRAVLVSDSIMEKLELKPGDSVYITWSSVKQTMECIVYASVSYWPTYNPNPAPEGVSRSAPQDFVVGNFNFWQKQMPLEPYEVWMKLEDGVTTEQIYGQLEELQTDLAYIRNTSQLLVQARNEPMLQGTNGSLTMSFIVTILVTMIGFLIYWIMAVKSRMLQFGILRSMGLSKLKMVGMLVWEQVLISGSAIAGGIWIGTLSARIFVPMLQMVSNAYEQVPPFRVLIFTSDYMRIFILVGAMVLLGLMVLSRIVTGMKLVQTLKLGED